MKKNIMVLLTAAAMVFSLACCGSQDKTEDGAEAETLTTYTSSSGYTVEYPSKYKLYPTDADEYDFMIADADSHTNVIIVPSGKDGELESVTTGQEAEDMLASQGIMTTVESVLPIEMNGMDAIIIQYKFMGNDVTQVCYFGNMDYIVTYTEYPNTPSEVSAELLDTAFSLKEN